MDEKCLIKYNNDDKNQEDKVDNNNNNYAQGVDDKDGCSSGVTSDG